MPSDDKFTLEYYAEQAKLCGDKWSSTMQDEIVRNKEIAFIKRAVCLVSSLLVVGKEVRVLDLGCGNGYATEVLARAFPQTSFWAVDFCDDLLSIARNRGIPNCQFSKGDARKLEFEDGFFDLVYTERCLINIRDWEEQKNAFSEVARVIRPRSTQCSSGESVVSRHGGLYAMIECFTDGHENYNRARTELGLDEIPLPNVNLFFDKSRTMFELEKYFKAYPGGHDVGFLSSHYFAARVLHACVQHKEVRNSEFVKFFSEALPNVGNYSPIQAFLWERK